MSTALSTRYLELVALANCSAAWIISAALLILDLLGRPAFKRRRNTPAFRLQSAGGLAILAGSY